MANKELLVTLGLDSTSYTQNVKKAKDLNKELDSSWKLLSSSSDNFEKSINGLAKKQDYLSEKMKVATGLSEVYAQRIKESQDALKEVSASNEEYAKKVKELTERQKKALEEFGKSSEQYKAVSKELKAVTQQYDKSSKAIDTHKKRILTAKIGYNETQTSLQSLGRMATFTGEQLSAMSKDNKLNGLKKSIGDLDHKFELVSSSVSNFSNTMAGLKTTQEHYNQRTKISKDLLKEYSEEIQNSSAKVQSYEKDLRDISEELETWQKLMDSYDIVENAEEYEQARVHVEGLRQEFSELNQILEFHKNRLEKVSSEYKTTEKDIAKMQGSLDATAKKMQSMMEKVTFEPVSKQINKLTNESITKLEKEMSDLDKEFELLTISAKDYESTLAGLELKQSTFKKSVDLATKSFEEYSSELKKIETETANLTKKQVELETEIKKQIEQLKKLDGAEWDKQVESIEKLKKEYEDVNKDLKLHNTRLKEVQDGYDSSRVKVAKLNRELDDTCAQMDSIAKKKIFDDFGAKVKNITDRISVLDSEFKILEGTIKKVFNAKKLASDKTEVLKSKITLLKSQLDVLNSTLTKNGKHLNNLKEEQEQVRISINKLKLAMLSMDKSSPKYAESLASLSRLEKAYEEVTKEVREFESENNRLQAEINETTASINNLTRETKEYAQSINTAGLTTFGEKIGNIGSKISQVGQSLLPMSLALGGLQASAIKTGYDFTKSMSKVGAVTQANIKELEELKQIALDLGKSTIFTNKDAADGLSYLGMAGLSVKQSIGALPEILKLAQAGSMELATASDKTTNALSSLGYIGDELVEKMPSFMNKIAQASISSNTNIEQMLDAYVKAGGQFDAMNISLDQSASMLGILATRGMVAEQAGNSLNSILINLTQTTGQSAEAMEALGVSAFDESGKMRDIEDIFLDLNKAMKSFGKEQKEIQFTNMLGGKTQAKTIQKLMQGMIDDTGNLSKEYLELKQAMQDAPNNDVLNKLSETMTDNLYGDFERLKSQISDSQYQIFNVMEDRLRNFTKKTTSIIEKITNAFMHLSPVMQNIAVGFVGFLAVAPPVLIAIGQIGMGIEAITKAVGYCSKAFNKFDGNIEKSNSKLKNLKQTMRDFVSESKGLTGKLDDYGSAVTNMFSKQAVAVKGFTSGLAGAIGGAIGGALTSLNFGAIGTAITGALSGVVTAITTAFVGLAAALGVSSGGLLAIIGAIVVAIVGIATHWEETCELMKKAWEKLCSWFDKSVEFFKGIFSKMGEGIVKAWDFVLEFFKSLPSKIVNFIKNIPHYINLIFRKAVELVGVTLGSLIGILIGIGATIVQIIEGIFRSVKGIGEIVLGIITLDFDKVCKGFADLFGGLADIIRSIVQNIWAIVSGTLENILGVFGINIKPITDKIENFFSTVWDKTVEFCSNIGLKTQEFFKEIFSSVGEWLGNVWESISNWFTETLPKIGALLLGALLSFGNWCLDMIAKLKEWLGEIKTNLSTWFSETWENIKTKFREIVTSFVHWCSEMKTKLKEWLTEFANDPIGKMKEFAINIKNGFVEGYNHLTTWCSDMTRKLIEWFPTFIENTASKISEWANKFKEGVAKITGYFKELPSTMFKIGVDMIKNLWNGFKSLLSDFKSWVGNSMSNIVDGLFSRSLDTNVQANVNYAGANVPSLLSDEIGNVRATGFSSIGNTLSSLISDVVSLDNYKISGGFYEPSSMNGVRVGSANNNDALIQSLAQQNQLLMQLLTSGTAIQVGVNVDGRQIAKASARYMNQEIEQINKRQNRIGGTY